MVAALARLRAMVLRAGSWPGVVLWAALIFALSSVRTEVVGRPSSIPFDKFAHAGVYAVLALLVALALSRRRPRVTLALALVALILAAAYGVSDEVHQGFVPGRDPSIADWSADVVGSTLGVAAATLLRNVRLARR